MNSRLNQFFALSVLASIMAIGTYRALLLSNERYFLILVLGRLAVAVVSLALLVFVVGKDKKSLPEGTTTLTFLAAAILESFIAYLQSDVTGYSYLLACLFLVLSSVESFIGLQASLISLLPSQLTVLGAPLMSLSHTAWTDRVSITQKLILPCATLLMSSLIWIFNSLLVNRKGFERKLRSMQRRQDLLHAQMFLLRRQPKTLVLPELTEIVRARKNDEHSDIKHEMISDQIELSDVIDLLRETISVVQSRFNQKKAQISLDLPAPITLPIKISAEKSDLQRILSSAVTKSINSLNGDDGVIRITLKVGYKAVSITMEDNGWGLKEKFSPNSETLSEVSLREMQAMIKFWGGRLDIQSRLGVGSRMYLELVRADAFATSEITVENENQPPSHITTGS